MVQRFSKKSVRFQPLYCLHVEVTSSRSHFSLHQDFLSLRIKLLSFLEINFLDIQDIVEKLRFFDESSSHNLVKRFLVDSSQSFPADCHFCLLANSKLHRNQKLRRSVNFDFLVNPVFGWGIQRDKLFRHESANNKFTIDAIVIVLRFWLRRIAEKKQDVKHKEGRLIVAIANVELGQVHLQVCEQAVKGLHSKHLDRVREQVEEGSVFLSQALKREVVESLRVEWVLEVVQRQDAFNQGNVQPESIFFPVHYFQDANQKLRLPLVVNEGTVSFMVCH